MRQQEEAQNGRPKSEGERVPLALLSRSLSEVADGKVAFSPEAESEIACVVDLIVEAAVEQVKTRSSFALSRRGGVV
jgi:hypothetical protein